ncbi:hypothetical protein PCANC_13120 [Puccinia coronata f. sp. avenae]|uniref:Uncharacterized protein n=1 Tax=Puccinia coronata f. sp. avenae TaxID=200324 RepID=A0A2N5UWN6_9BASI|nr:hypothetical protein PCANC_13120 [Puccinia coronata f. sp. avenae]
MPLNFTSVALPGFRRRHHFTSDCGPSNPHQNLLKHSDRHPIPSRFKHAAHQQASSHITQAHLHPSASSSNLSNGQRQASPFLMHELNRELESINHIHQSAQPSQINPAWQKQFIGHFMKHSVSMDEMARMERSFHSVQPSSQAPPAMHWSQQFTHNHDQASKSSSRSIHHMSPLSITLWRTQSRATLGSPRHKWSSLPQIVELTKENWEAEFAKIGNQLKAQPTAESQEHPPFVDQQSPLSSLSQDTTPQPGHDLGRHRGGHRVPEDDFVGPDLSRPLETTITPENVGNFLDHPEPYLFQSNNPYVGVPDPFEEGQRLLRSGATLSEAALAFEAACQAEENQEDSWRMLGETQAADEKEQLAIKAFQRAVGCQEMRALAILERWLMDTYPAIAANVSANQKSNEDQHNPWSRHAMVVEKFILAARAGPEV